MSTTKDADKKILDYLETVEWPVTSEDVAKKLGITWHTAQVHLMKLYAERKVKYRKVGRQNQWWKNKGYDKEMK